MKNSKIQWPRIRFQTNSRTELNSDDRDSVLAVFTNLDRDSVYTRFFTYKRVLTEHELRQLTDVDNDHVVALVVGFRDQEQAGLLGGGRYYRTGEKVAEIAFTTADNFRGRGVTSLVLRQLILIGRAQGILYFEADVLHDNSAMLAVLRNCGLEQKWRGEAGIFHVTLHLNA